MTDETNSSTNAVLTKFVSEDAALGQVLAALDAAPGARIALDTEADSFHHYYEKTCLLQLAIGDDPVIVDPLAGLDLAPLMERLATHPLLLHGADYDLRLLWRGYRFRASAVFDTMIAAQLLGEKEIGLAAQLLARCGVTLDKAHQRADWSLRPLPASYLVYAAADVTHLGRLVDSMTADLVAKGRLPWHQEECERLVAGTFDPAPDDLENDWRLKGTNGIASKERAFVRALWHVREARAKELDRPPFRVLTNERLLAASALAVKGERDLAKLFPGPRPLPPPFARAVRDAIGSAAALLPADWPEPKRGERAPAEPELEPEVEKLRKRRDQLAKDLALDPGVVVSKAMLTAAARASRAQGGLSRLTPDTLARESGMSRWRAALLVGA